MDLFDGAVSPPTQFPTDQIHDFNPGIRPSGLFWTVPVKEDALQVDLANGKATLALTNFGLEDYGTLENALMDGPELDASVTFKMTWTATGDPFNVSDPVHQFAGRYSLARVDISWTGTNESGFSFASSPGITQVKSVIGRERNGIFFAED